MLIVSENVFPARSAPTAQTELVSLVLATYVFVSICSRSFTEHCVI